jgi:hypothetical protein
MVVSPEVEMIVYERHDLSKELFRGLEFEKWFYIFIQGSYPTTLLIVVRIVTNTVFFH